LIHLSFVFFIVGSKNDSRDDVSLVFSEANNDHTRNPAPCHFNPSTVPSSSSSSSSSSNESDSSSDEYSNSSLHGSHLGLPSLDEDADLEVDQIPLSKKSLYASTNSDLFNVSE
jgi:hypothetical protein